MSEERFNMPALCKQQCAGCWYPSRQRALGALVSSKRHGSQARAAPGALAAGAPGERPAVQALVAAAAVHALLRSPLEALAHSIKPPAPHTGQRPLHCTPARASQRQLKAAARCGNAQQKGR